MKFIFPLFLLLPILPASAVTFACKNPNGKASISGAAIVGKDAFMGVPRITVYFPRVLEGRDFTYSTLVVGTDQANISTELRPLDGTFLRRPDYFYIVVNVQKSDVPMTFTAHYGLDKCQTVTRAVLQ